ncbi:MAG: DUF1294 domain-containing protein [Clostridia bacterium]|nr:DUF1294 domain-containing protein [Clostridia bacterium]
MDHNRVILYIVTAINVLAFVTMGIDKLKAVKGKRRISENTLLILALAGGGVGFSLAMVLFRHKLSKVRFRVVAAVSITFYWVVLFLFIYSKTGNV